MDNASKNASDMIGSLQMKYNRGRQAAITNELVDIITGLHSSLQSVRGITDTRPRCQRLVVSENSLEGAIDSVTWCNPLVFGFPNSVYAIDLQTRYLQERCFHRRIHLHFRLCRLRWTSDGSGVLHKVKALFLDDEVS
jgi:hypothetical protein